MLKNIIAKRNKSICNSIDEFLLAVEFQPLSLQDEQDFQNLINHFQDSLNEEKNSWFQFILKEIENQQENLLQKREDIKMYRKEKAKVLNQLIIINRRLKRNIQEDIIKKNQITNEKNNQILPKQIDGIYSKKQILLQIYSKIKRLNDNKLSNFSIEIDNMKKDIKKIFHQIQYEIYEYQKSMLTSKKKEALKQLLAAQQYYLTEINKLQQFNKDINSSLNYLCSEFNILPIEFSSTEIKNKSLSVGEDAIFNELSKISSIRKRIGPKPSAKIIVNYIVAKLKEKDKSIINSLQKKEDSCAILKERIKRAEIKNQFNISGNGSFNSNLFDREQSEIEKNLHDIKLMQKKLFE